MREQNDNAQTAENKALLYGRSFRLSMIHITDAISLDEREIDERFVRASGPGGQNVNKVATAVELRFNVASSSLAEEVKQRLMQVAGPKRMSDGILTIDSREHRTQSQNRVAARARLVAMIQQALVKPRHRRKTKPTSGARERRLTAKKLRGNVKEGRRRRERDD
jgi:ribosome-associated protein